VDWEVDYEKLAGKDPAFFRNIQNQQEKSRKSGIPNPERLSLPGMGVEFIFHGVITLIISCRMPLAFPLS